MNKNSILAYLEDVKRILNNVKLLKSENTTRKRSISSSKFSEAFIHESQKNNYIKLFNIILKNADFDFILKDDSVFQFSCSENGKLENGTIRYTYYPNPYECKSYEDFLIENGENINECGDLYREKYLQYISECEIKQSITPIRYDYDYSSYTPCKHPISHLHIGLEQDFRIPVSKMLTPVKFTVFVMKNIYFEHWSYGYNDEMLYNRFLSAKAQCEKLNSDLFGDSEKQMLYLD